MDVFKTIASTDIMDALCIYFDLSWRHESAAPALRKYLRKPLCRALVSTSGVAIPRHWSTTTLNVKTRPHGLETLPMDLVLEHTMPELLVDDWTAALDPTGSLANSLRRW